MSNVWTIGWLALPSDSQEIFVFSVTACGWLLVPARLGETEALTVTFGATGASAIAAASPEAAIVARNATTPSLRMVWTFLWDWRRAATAHTLAESDQTCTAMFLSPPHPSVGLLGKAFANR